MKSLRYLILGIVAVMIVMSAGCQSASLRSKYQVGRVENIHLLEQKAFKQWVEMTPGQPSQVSTRNTKEEMVLTRTVESVASDGSAVMNVVMNKVDVVVDVNVPDKKTLHSYASTPQKTSSTWGGEPNLAGMSYRIKIAPDSTVREVMGLDVLRQKLALKEGDKGIVAGLIAESRIKQLHQRNFLMGSPAAVSPGASWQKTLEIPDPLIKAKAIRNTYRVAPQTGAADTLVTVNLASEPLYTLPKGIAEPPVPPNPFLMLVREKGDMQEFTLTGASLFDASAGVVRSSRENLRCLLILLGKNIFADSAAAPDAAKKQDQGAMFIELQFASTYDLLP